MGKKSNQIATFQDLKDIGYRFPSELGSDLTKCVTAHDLYQISNYSDSNYQTLYSALSQVYFLTTNAGWQNTSPITYDSEILEGPILPSTTPKSFTSSSSTTHSYKIGTFTTPNGVTGLTKINFPNIGLGILVKYHSSSVQIGGNLTLALKIQPVNSSDSQTVRSITRSMTIALNANNNYIWDSSWAEMTYGLGSLRLDPNTTYDLIGDFTFTGTSGPYYYGLTMIPYFMQSGSKLSYYVSSKCIPWQDVPGSFTNSAKVTITCRLYKTEIWADPDMTYLKLYYVYTENGTTKTQEIGSRSDFQVTKDDKNFTFEVPVDYLQKPGAQLRIVLNPDTSKRNYDFYYYIIGESNRKLLKSFSNTKDTMTCTFGSSYSETIRTVRHLEIHIT